MSEDQVDTKRGTNLAGVRTRQSVDKQDTLQTTVGYLSLSHTAT